MKTFDEIIKKRKSDARKSYHSELADIDERYGDYHTAYLIAKKWNDKFGEGAEVAGNLTRIYLKENQNIAITFNEFMEENEYLVSRYGTSRTQTDAYSVDIEYGSFVTGIRVWVYYQGGNCERKVIRTETKVVEKPVYEIVCN